ncbi:MAG: proteasome activator [Actinomycetota bacterium]
MDQPVVPGPGVEQSLPEEAVPPGDRALDPEKLLRVAGLARAVLDEVRQMDPDQHTIEELTGLHRRVRGQMNEALPNELVKELAALDLDLSFQDRATGQEVRVAYSGLIGWLGGLFQGLSAAMQMHQLQGLAALQRGTQEGQDPGQPDIPRAPGPYL